jgi:hypothetical protein
MESFATIQLNTTCLEQNDGGTVCRAGQNYTFTYTVVAAGISESRETSKCKAISGSASVESPTPASCVY